MSKMNADDLRSVLEQSHSVWNLKEALRRALEIIVDQEEQIDSLNEQIELDQLEP